MKYLLFALYFLFLGAQTSANSGQEIPVHLLRDSQKVSLVFVGSREGLNESSFGHIALRFSPGTELGIFDTNIQFVASQPEQNNILEKYTKGLGVFGNYAYDVVLEFDSFTNYEMRKIKEEDREVYVYPLELTEEQRQALVEYVVHFYESDIQRKYRFFNRNCSYFAADAIETALGVDLQAKSFPWKISENLEKMGVIKETIHLPSTSLQRENLVEELYQSPLSETLTAYLSQREFLEGINHEKMMVKNHPYFLLLSLAHRSPLYQRNEDMREMALSLYKKLISRESDSLKAYYLAILKQTNEQSLTHYQMNRRFDRRSSILNLEGELKVVRDQVRLRLSWDERVGGNERERMRLDFPLSTLQYNAQTMQIEKDGKRVASALFTRGEEWVSPTHLNYSVALNTKKEEILVIQHVSKSEAVSSLEELSDKDILALSNIVDFEGEDLFGACLAMVKIQKALLERAQFNPEASLHEDMDKLQILKDVLNGQFVIIPGFAGIADFTASIEKERLISFVSDYQRDLNGNTRTAFFDGLFRYQEVKDKNFKNLQSLINSGTKVELVIGFKKKESRRFETVSHVVLITGMEEKKDGEKGWELTVYDPNLKLIKVPMTEDFKLKLPSIYRDDFDYIPVLYKQERAAIDRDLGMQSLDLDWEKLMKRSSRGVPLYFNPIQYIN